MKKIRKVKNKRTLICPVCKKTFKIPRSSEGYRKYCSKKCAKLVFKKQQRKLWKKYRKSLRKDKKTFPIIQPNTSLVSITNYRNFWKKQLLRECR